MTQNRNKLIDLFISNISNTIVHKILEKAIDDENIRDHYTSELQISLNISKKYREKINPINTKLPDKDLNFIKDKITKRVKSELQSRISQGYENINLNLIDIVIEDFLKQLNIL